MEPAPAGDWKTPVSQDQQASSQAPLHPHLRASLALTRQRAQQSPWEHWAPARNEQLCAKQQGSKHSWSRKGEEGPGE